MDRDSITRTGARTPGVGREPERWHGTRIISLGSEREYRMSLRGHAKDGCKPTEQSCMPGAGFSERYEGKAPSDIPALKPYWGKPTVRNFRGVMETAASSKPA